MGIRYRDLSYIEELKRSGFVDKLDAQSIGWSCLRSGCSVLAYPNSPSEVTPAAFWILLLRHFFDDLAGWAGGGAEHGGVDSLRFFSDKGQRLELQHAFRLGFELRIVKSGGERFSDDLQHVVRRFRRHGNKAQHGARPAGDLVGIRQRSGRIAALHLSEELGNEGSSDRVSRTVPPSGPSKPS